MEEADLRIVDDHRDDKAKWVKVGVPDAGKQARVLSWRSSPDAARRPWRSPTSCPRPRNSWGSSLTSRADTPGRSGY